MHGFFLLCIEGFEALSGMCLRRFMGLCRERMCRGICGLFLGRNRAVSVSHELATVQNTHTQICT